MAKDCKQAQQQNQRCRLLTLPREIRDIIWREALIEKHYISISEHTYVFPSLLAASKRTRQECTLVYLLENTFAFELDDFNGAWTAKFYMVVGEKMKALNYKPTDQPSNGVSPGVFCADVVINGLPNWQNLLDWLETYHRLWKSCPAWNESGQDYGSADVAVLNGAFGILIELYEQPWERIRVVLEQFHRTLVFVDPLWA